MNNATNKSDAGLVLGMSSCYALGSFTDNFFKQAIVLLAASMHMPEMQSIATVLFSLPFILFSAWAGWLADTLPKKRIVVLSKAIELGALMVGTLFLLWGLWWGILLVVFCMGLQATAFSPALNGSIPENCAPTDVPRVNSFVKLASTIAVLAGMAAAGVFMDIRPGGILPVIDGLTGEAYGRLATGIFASVVGIVGLFTALGLRSRPALIRERKNPFPLSGPVESVFYLLDCRKDSQLFLVLVAEAFFYGIAALTVISVSNLATTLGYSNTIASQLSACLMVGIAVGAIFAGKRSADSWKTLLAPAVTGMGLCMLSVAMAPFIPSSSLLGTVVTAQLLWLGLSLFACGVCGGVYLIPLASFIQLRPAAEDTGKVLGVSNFFSFVAIGAFGAVFALIGLLPPALTFVVYGMVTIGFALYLAKRIRVIVEAG